MVQGGEFLLEDRAPEGQGLYGKRGNPSSPTEYFNILIKHFEVCLSFILRTLTSNND